jgi:hypothetical protein
MHLYIIHEGILVYYMNDVDLISNLPILESDIDTVNLTWEAGDEQVRLVLSFFGYIIWYFN